MVAKNDITGDSIQTRGSSKAYLDNYDLIFGKKKKTNESAESTSESLLQELVDVGQEFELNSDGMEQASLLK